jgi:hypothetical protein|tara:strand:- start:82 stop:333 length:252 start_codon:yes stop_codon:yes gene_type:complete
LIISNPEDALRTLVTAEELAKSLKHYEAAILDQLAREKSFRDGLSPDVTIARRASKSLGVAPWGDMADLNTPFEYVTDEFEHF